MKAKITTAANIPAATRRAVYRRDGYRCALCDDVRGLQIHHAMPRSVGGSDDEMNLVTLCWPATQKRTAHSCPNVTARRVRPKNSRSCAARSRKRTRRTLWNTSQTSTRKKV